MDFLGKSKPELVDHLISLASTLKEEDLQDPAMFGQVSQLLQILDPQSEQLPADIVQKLQSIPDPKQRLMEAAFMTGATSAEEIGRLVESMKTQGLMKSEEADEVLAKVSPKEIQNSHILMFPVSIRGQTKQSGDHSDYHATLKWLGNNKKSEDHEKVQDLVNRYNLHPPSDFEIEPDVWHTPRGPVHVLKLKGQSKGLEYAHHELSEDSPSMHKFIPHITVSKELHDEVKEKGLKAKDLNIKIHPLEYRVGNETKKRYIPTNPPQASEAVYPFKIAKAEDMEKYKKVLESLRKAEKHDLADRLEKTLKDLEKGQDEKNNPIRGRNKRLQQAKAFGKPSDVKTDKKGVQHYKIPNPNGARTSPERMKMMNHIKQYAENKMGAKMTIAEGKRDESGQLKNKAGIEKQPFDVFTPEGHKQEKARKKKIDATNKVRESKGQKPIKRIDPKPDHRSGNLETQPSPDAAIHEIAHEALAPKGMSMEQHQTHMDERWGDSQKKYGHMQQKKTRGELGAMSVENKIRREIGLTANSSHQKVKDPNKPVEQAIDNTGPRFHRGKDKKGRTVDYMRQSRNATPEEHERIDQLRDGRLKYSKQGITEGTSPDAKINARAAQAKAPQASVSVKPEPKPANHINKKPEKLAANEEHKLEPGMSFRDLKKKIEESSK